MRSRRALAITLTLCVLIASIAFPALATGSVLAQDGDDDDDDVPGLPANYYGEIELSDGTLSEQVLIEVVADGEVQDSMMTDEDGQFGGPTIGDDKLEVQPPEDEEVTFRVGGVDVDTTEFESGAQEINLTASQDELKPRFNTTVTETNSPVDGGETLTVDAAIENEGALSGTQDIELKNSDGDTVDSASASLAYNESTSASLSLETDTDTSINETFTVESEDSAASVDVVVKRVTPPQIAPQPSQPTTGDSDNDSDGDDTDGETTGGDDSDLPSDVEAVQAEQQAIVSDEDSDLSQVRFTEESDIVSITWDSADVAGNVSTSTLNTTPNETGPAPGALVSASQIEVPDNVTSESATVQFRVDATQVEDVDAEADDLQVSRFADEEWQQIDTSVIEESSDEIILQAETPGFSYFAVSATGEPTAAISSPDEVTTGESVSLNASESTDKYGEIASYEWVIDGESYDDESVTTEFDQAGDVDVELTVENDAGETNTTTETISVVESSDTSNDSSGNGSSDGTDNTDNTDDSIPGFTAGLALIALVISALIARKTTS